MRCEARRDRGGLARAFEACLRTPCIARKFSGVLFEQFERALDGCRVLSFYVDGEPVGAAMFRETDGHIAVIPEFHGRWCTPAVLREIRREWGARRRALVDEENDTALDFVRRLGLSANGMDNNIVRFVNDPQA